MLTPSQKEELKAKLQEVNTAQDLFDFLERNYDLKSVELGFLTKPKMISGAIEIIHVLNPRKKFPNLK